MTLPLETFFDIAAVVKVMALSVMAVGIVGVIFILGTLIRDTYKR
jgi:hypothetical protein